MDEGFFPLWLRGGSALYGLECFCMDGVRHADATGFEAADTHVQPAAVASANTCEADMDACLVPRTILVLRSVLERHPETRKK